MPPSQRRKDDKTSAQRLVSTPYGKGLVVKTYKTSSSPSNPKHEIHLLDWKSSSPQKKPPTLYSHAPLVSVTPSVGDDVITTYGRGTISSITSSDSNNNSPTKYLITLTSWRLANRSTV
eukprot:CAMPEP_0172510790 /NCGR_PEP_ID=MMETSP1066-20121228/231387_1 /TAXON_ID=671091 /ORGANISM="Coscinodiscus wailesii, Strain CCMP2513" /LENGTH=118 /DNA_ID=CAMNT_0013289921 /DNA_START=20 /DNA_END=372 /DNA_ORIENTATION=-